MTRLDIKSIVIAALAVLVVWMAADLPLLAGTDGGGGDSDRGLIAVTGAYGSGASALYLIDSKTRHLAVYRLENGRALEFVAARDCTYDFLLETYNDDSATPMTPSMLRKSWQDINRRGGRPPGPGTAPGGGTTPGDAPAGDDKGAGQVVPPTEKPPAGGGKGSGALEGARGNG